jgi:hypothetical protein
MVSKNLWVTSVNELAQIFRDALVGLIPIAERAHMPWKEPSNYDDWNSIAAALYESLVVRSIEESSEWNKFEPIPKYNKRVDRYSNNSLLTTHDEPVTRAFICFETDSNPFDTCLFARLDETNRVTDFEHQKTNSVNFVLAARTKGSTTIVDTLHVLL